MSGAAVIHSWQNNQHFMMAWIDRLNASNIISAAQMASTISTFCSPAHCVKSVRILSFSTPIPVFSPNAGEKTDQKHSQYENFLRSGYNYIFPPHTEFSSTGAPDWRGNKNLDTEKTRNKIYTDSLMRWQLFNVLKLDSCRSYWPAG